MGKLISEEDFALMLIASLPPSYDELIESFTMTADMNKTDITLDLVYKRVCDAYDKRLLRQETSGNGQDESFAASTQKSKSKKDIECYNCRKKGHIKADCWAKGGGKEGQGPRRRQGSTQANAAAVSEKPEDESWAIIEVINDEDDTMAATTTTTTTRTDDRSHTELYDSGTSRHMTPHRDKFITYQRIGPRPIVAADKGVFYAIGKGDMRIQVPNGQKTTEVLLRNTLHAPDMGLTVISVGRIANAGNTVVFEGNTCKIKNKSGMIIGDIPAGPNGLYKVDHTYIAMEELEQVDMLTIHRRLGHISPNSIRTLIRSGAVTGLQLDDTGPSFMCPSCEYAKTTRKIINKERVADIADTFGAEVHTDLWGPSPVQTIGGRKYYVSFTDDHTRYTKIVLLKTKDQALQAYKEFANWTQTQHGVRIKRLRSDRGGEYTGGEFTKFLQDQGTERRLTTHDTPQHNGVAESLNRRILERVRVMLHHAGLPKYLWGEAILFAAWLKNQTSTKALGQVTPFE